MSELPHRRSIRTFALVCVAVTSVFVMAMSIWLISVLSSPDWCDHAVGVGADVGLRQSAFGGCFALLKSQISALAFNSYVFAGTVSLCLVSLMVIVVAGGRISFSGTKNGLSGNISSANDATPPPPANVTTTTTTATRIDEPPVFEDAG